MRIGVVRNRHREGADEFVDRLLACARQTGVEVELDQSRLATDPPDVVVAVGGDGTVLEAVRVGLEIERPVLGFNLGTIGFLADAEPDELESALRTLAAGEYEVEERATLVATLEDGRVATGVNDVVVEKIESQRLVVLAVEIDGEDFLTYRADGIVVATSTGSTAYAFSAGGPLVDPSLDAVLVTPVAAHSLFSRTLVLPGKVRVRCRVVGDRPVRVSVDGVEVGTLRRDEVVDVEKGSRSARFVSVVPEGFPARVTRKFGLG